MNKVSLKTIGMILVSCLLVSCSANNSPVKSDALAADSNSVKSCCQHKKGKKCPASNKAVKPDCCKKAEGAKPKSLKTDNSDNSAVTETNSKAVNSCCQHKKGKKCPASNKAVKPDCCKTAKDLKSKSPKEEKENTPDQDKEKS